MKSSNIKNVRNGILIALSISMMACGSEKTLGTQSEENGTLMEPAHSYSLKKVVEVSGRQGIAAENGRYWVSGSTTLEKYDSNWRLLAGNTDPFSDGFEKEVNHIGDIDVYNNEIYCGVELFLDGVASNIQVAVYDGNSLQLNRVFSFEPDSGQTECSGICIDPDHKIVWMCSWEDGESGRYLYKYDLESGAYLGKVHLHAVPQWIQGIAYHDGAIYITSDDGNADDGEADHIYRTEINENSTEATVVLERTLDDVTLYGEIEGLTFDKDQKQMLVLYNRGARIILGMPSGFYDGYDHEIHEVFVYSMK